VNRNFSVSSARATSNGSILLTYTALPLAVANNSIKDALRPQNYVLNGPGSRKVKIVKEDLTDLSTFELLLDGPLQIGNWSLTVKNVETPFGEKLTNTTTSFVWPVPASLVLPAYAAGYRSVRDFLNPALKGPRWEALIKALGWSNQKLFDYGRFVIDQLFLHSSTGRYLTKRAQEYGINRNQLIGFPDELFRRYAEGSIWGKLSLPGIWNTLDVFYGEDGTRATAISEIAEPYALTGNENLIIETDNKTWQLYIESSILENVGAASAFSVASSLNYSAYRLNAPFYFEAYRLNNKYYLKVINRIIGNNSTLRFLGGKVNQIVRFPERILLYNTLSGPLPTWTITYDALDAVTVFTTTTTPTGYDLTKVNIGDLALIYGSEFSNNNKGTYQVIDVTTSFSLGILTQTIKVKNTNPFAQVVTQLSESSLLFFRPIVIHRSDLGPRCSISLSKFLDIELPVFTRVAPRNLYSGAYLHDWGDINATTAYRWNNFLTITTPSHNLNSGDWIEINEPKLIYSKPSLTPSAVGTTSASVSTVWSPIDNMAIARSEGASLKLSSTDILITGGFDGAVYSTNCQRFRITGDTILTNGGRQLTYNWIATAPLPSGRNRHQLTSMGYYEGFAILTGGYNGIAVQNNTYRYENSSNTWTTVSNMPYSAFWHRAVAWDTQVLISGGFNINALNSTAYYEPTTDVWTSGANLIYARYKHTYSIHKYNGNLCQLVTGGLDINNKPTNKCEEFNGVSWIEVGSMTWARYGHKALPLPNGKIMVVGGIGVIASQPTMLPINVTAIEIYDPEQKTWSAGGELVEGIGEGFAQIIPETSLLNYPDFPIGNKIVIGGGPSSRMYEKLYNEPKWKYGDILDIAYNSPSYAGDDWILVNGGTALPEVRLYIPGATEYVCKGPKEYRKITSIIDANTIQVNDFEGVSYWSSVKIKSIPVLNTNDWNGPYISSDNPPINNYESVITMNLVGGLKYSTLDVSNAPLSTPPYIMIDIGGKYRTGPIKVFGRESPTRLRIDSEFTIPIDIPFGTRIYGLSQKDKYNPPINIGYLYLTGSDIPVNDLKEYLFNSTAAGLEKTIKIKYPFVKGIGAEHYPDDNNDKLNDKQIIWSGK